MFVLAVMVFMPVFLGLSAAGTFVESMETDELTMMGVAIRSESPDLSQRFA